MLSEKLDYFFPFIVFFYGILLVFVLEIVPLNRLGPIGRDFHIRLMAHRGLAWICFWAGGLWSLQNLMF